MNDLSYTKFYEWIEDNKDTASMIINNAINAATRREKIKTLKETI